MINHSALLAANTSELSRISTVMELSTATIATEQGLDDLSSLLHDLKRPSLQERVLCSMKSMISNIPVHYKESIQDHIVPLLSSAQPMIRTLATDCLSLLWLNDFTALTHSLTTLLTMSSVPKDCLPTLLEITGNLGFVSYIPFIEKYSEHESPYVRKKAVEALGKISGPEVLMPLLRALFDSDKDVREVALWGLDILWIGYQTELVPLLIDALNQTEEEPLQDYIISTLQNTRDTRAMPILEQFKSESKIHH